MQKRLLLFWGFILVLTFCTTGFLAAGKTNLAALQTTNQLMNYPYSAYECAILAKSLPPNTCNSDRFELEENNVFIGYGEDQRFQLSPKRDATDLAQGAALMQNGGQDQAIEIWQTIPNVEWYFYRLSENYEDVAVKIELYQLSNIVRPNLASYLELSKIYETQRNYEAVIEVSDAGIQKLSTDSLANPYLLALLYQQSAQASYSLKDSVKAQERFSRALDLWPDLPESIAGLARIEIAQGDYTGAIGRLTNGLNIVTRKFWLYYWLAVAYNDLGVPEKAVEMLYQALDDRNNFAVAWRLLGDIASQQGDLELAIQAYENYLSIMPDDLSIEERLNTLDEMSK